MLRKYSWISSRLKWLCFTYYWYKYKFQYCWISWNLVSFNNLWEAFLKFWALLYAAIPDVIPCNYWSAFTSNELKDLAEEDGTIVKLYHAISIYPPFIFFLALLSFSKFLQTYRLRFYTILASLCALLDHSYDKTSNPEPCNHIDEQPLPARTHK